MMTELLKLLPTIIRNSGESEEAREQAGCAAGVGAVGWQIRQISCPLKVERKPLIIAVLSNTWRPQLRRMRDPLLFKLNSLLGSPIITTIEFVINPDMINAVLKKPQEVSFIAPTEHQENLRENADA